MIAILAAAVCLVIGVDTYGMYGAGVSQAAGLLAGAIDAALGQRTVPVACATH